MKLELRDKLEENTHYFRTGIAEIGFSFPVVPQGKARIRTQVSAAHSHDDLTFALEKFAEAKAELGL